jgi:hypothetical protein
MLGLLGFLLVATAQVSNMILARGVAGSVPPFSIAFFRWSIVALGLLPVVVMALREKPGVLHGQTPGIVAAGFLGMFICGGPVYVAGVTTSAINLALIMALAPLAVLLFSFISEKGRNAISPISSPTGAIVPKDSSMVLGRACSNMRNWSMLPSKPLPPRNIAPETALSFEALMVCRSTSST